MSDGSKQANFHNLLMQTSTAGQQRFVIRGGEPFHGCIDCPAIFPQTDDGWNAKNNHAMEHGRPTLYDALDLNEKSLRIFVVETDDSRDWEDQERVAHDIYGQDDEGNIYHLRSVNRWDSGLWKWKRQPQGNSPPPMLRDQESPWNGSGSMVER